MDLWILDIALRGVATGMFLIFVPVIWLDRISRQAQITLSLVAIGVLARLWSTLPPGIEVNETALIVLRLLGTSAAFSITWFMLTIFLDTGRHFWVWLLSGALISLAIPASSVLREIIPFVRVYAVLHFVALTGLVIASGRGDLIDARRRIRPGMLIFLSFFCIGQALSSTQMVGVTSMGHALGHSMTLCFVTFVFAVWSVRANLANWPGRITARKTTETPNQIARAQDELIARIEEEMNAGIWRREGLTVAALAQEVGAPEHRVRKAINQVLGYRNFASFINKARVEAAKTQLRSAESAQATILEIAFAVGFSSIGPFNRAFRDITGQSPTEFRDQLS